MEVWILVNNRAGRQHARENGEQVRRVFALGGARARVAYTDTVEEGAAFLQQAAEAQPDLLVCCGGDGTLSQALNVLQQLDAKLPLGYVPMGTTNDFAASLGLPKEPAKAAEQILHGQPRLLDLGRFGEREFLYVASFGAFTQSSYKAAPQVKAVLGHLAYVLESARELPFLQAIPLEAEVDGRASALLALVENLQRRDLHYLEEAEAIAAFSPRQTVLAASFLVGLYALKSLSVCFPMSALTAAGGLLFPFPLALAVNLCGTAVAQTIPFFLGRREQGGLEALAERYPRVAGICRAQAEDRWLSVFLLRLAGASPGDVVSLYLGASGTPCGVYLSAGLLGGLPRIACATVLGGALWQPGSGRFWLSLAAGGALTALSGVIWLLWRRRRRA